MISQPYRVEKKRTIDDNKYQAAQFSFFDFNIVFFSPAKFAFFNKH